MSSLPGQIVNSELPSLATWQNESGQYLVYRHERTDITFGLLHFNKDIQAADLAAQFEFEKAKTWDNLYHIKSRYNNKYFVRWTPDSDYITASAYAPDENKSSWTCTLFEPKDIKHDDTKVLLKLRHVQFDRYVCSSKRPGTFESYLFVPKTEKEREEFTLVDWSSHSNSDIKLPKYVAFKATDGDQNYVTVTEGPHGEEYYLKFSVKDYKESPEKTVHEIFPTPEGILYIKSADPYDFWKTTHNEDMDVIVADADDPRPQTKHNVAAMFRLAVVDTANNMVTLQNMNTFRFCKRLDEGDYKDYVGDKANSDEPAARWVMVPVDPEIGEDVIKSGSQGGTNRSAEAAPAHNASGHGQGGEAVGGKPPGSQGGSSNEGVNTGGENNNKTAG